MAGVFLDLRKRVAECRAILIRGEHAAPVGSFPVEELGEVERHRLQRIVRPHRRNRALVGPDCQIADTAPREYLGQHPGVAGDVALHGNIAFETGIGLDQPPGPEQRADQLLRTARLGVEVEVHRPHRDSPRREEPLPVLQALSGQVAERQVQEPRALARPVRSRTGGVGVRAPQVPECVA